MNSQKPVKNDKGSIMGVVYNHPAFGCITLHRVSTSGGGSRLFGTDFGHRHFMKLVVHHAEQMRSSTYERHFETKQIIEFYMSEAQWATFISSVNFGSGVPCTLGMLGSERVPDIEPDSAREERFSEGLTDRLADAQAVLKEVLTDINNGKMGKTNLRDKVQRALMQIGVNTEYTQEMLDEYISKKIEAAKVEIHAYATYAIHSAGIASLNKGDPILSLEDKSSDQSD